MPWGQVCEHAQTAACQVESDQVTMETLIYRHFDLMCLFVQIIN